MNITHLREFHATMRENHAKQQPLTNNQTILLRVIKTKQQRKQDMAQQLLKDIPAKEKNRVKVTHVTIKRRKER